MAFDNITTIDGWSAALKELLDRALTNSTV
jgi:hypothetical protein